MKTKNRLLIFFLVAAVAASIGYVSYAQDENSELLQEEMPNIAFPIAELGGCNSKEECRIYCDNLDHADACRTWAEKNGIAVSAPRRGPGGCDSHEACDTFCRNPSNTPICTEFAVKEGNMTQVEADRILKAFRMRQEGPRAIPRVEVPRGPRVPRGPQIEIHPEIDKERAQELLETQGGPGGCTTFSECEAFCNNSANEKVCFQFAVDHQLMRPADVERLQKLRNAEGPGGCRGRACEQYCEQRGNEGECIEFARKQGFIGEEEYRHAKKFIDAAKDGGPGGCRGRACEQYCNNPQNRKECLAFAKKHSLIPEHEAETIERIEKKLEGGGGPGGCRAEEECRQYCSDPSRFDECAAFAVDAGLIPPDQAKQMLQQFIEVEKFKQGAPGHGFEPRALGPSAGFEDKFRGEFNAEFDQEFERRFQQFEQHREFFEKDVPPPRFVPPDSSTLHEGAKPPEGFKIPDGFHPPTDARIPGGIVPPDDIRRQIEEQKHQEEFRRVQDEFFQREGSAPPDDGFVPPPSTVGGNTGASPFQVFLDIFGLRLR